MTEIDMKKIGKYRERVLNYLEDKRYEEGKSKTDPTHLSYGTFIGKFCLDSTQYKEFLALYIKAVSMGINNFSILEKQKEYAPLIIDIDLEVATENYIQGTRLYDDNMIKEIIKRYITSINTYLDITYDKQKICLFEKKNASEKEITVKDGFHLMFADLCVPTKVRHLLRYKVVKMCQDDGLFDNKNYVNNVDKIIDKAVVSSNGWFLYGSRKPNGPLYDLTKIYNYKGQIIYDHIKGVSYNPETNEENEEYYDQELLIKYFSVQNSKYNKKNLTPLNNEYANSDIDLECEKLGINSSIKSEQIKIEVPASKEDDVRRANKLVSMLNEQRATDYSDWIHVGLALHNIDNSLLTAFIEFSKKCPQKFKEGECEKTWKTMKNPSNGNMLTIRSLAYWAKQDDPKQYEQYSREEFKNTMRKSLDGNTYYLAKSVHAKYNDRFVCSDIKTNMWWQFNNHRWERIQEGYTLKILFSEEFVNEYHIEAADISLLATKVSGIEKEQYTKKLEKIYKIIEKLMNNTFKKTLLDECKSLFYDSKFEDKLDSNIHLIGFENGVFDLEKESFRDGRPDDYITLNTKNHYYKWNEKSPWNEQIFKFFDQVMPNEKVRKYFLNALCTCISGETKEEKLYIMTGSGSNGKSLTMDLMYASLGEYYMSCPITIITRKRGQSNETSPEKVRMKGRRCGVFQETDDGEKMNVGVMKEFTGGDKVLVRDLFKGSNEMIEFKPQMKYFLTCNQLPEVPSNDDGTWRRLRVIEFTSKFTDNPTKPNEFKIDTKLKQTIELWAPTFISYLLHIYITEYKNKVYLTEPDEVMTSTKQYKEDNDFYSYYIHEKITITNNNKDSIGREALWEDFKVWYKNDYDPKTLPKKQEFNRFMSKQLGEPTRKGYLNITFTVTQNEKISNDLDI